MGEMADYYNEFDNYEENEPEEIICKICGERYLHWCESKTDNRWFLVDENDKAHRCNPLAAYMKKFG